MLTRIMSGLLLARISCEMDGGTKTIPSTTRDSDYREAGLSNVGVQAFPNKPYTGQTLLGTVGRVPHTTTLKD